MPEPASQTTLTSRSSGLSVLKTYSAYASEILTCSRCPRPCSDDPNGGPISVIPSDFGWNDVGSWEALSDYNEADADGNITAGRVIAVDSTNSIIQSHGPAISVLGMESVVIVSTNDAILVCPKGLVQRVKEIPALAKALDWRDLC